MTVREVKKPRLSALSIAFLLILTGSAVTHAESIGGTVFLDPELKSKVNPEDAVFIFAQALEGSKVPLAIVKGEVKDLPMTFLLDDSKGMMPDFKLSSQSEVTLIGRITGSGKAYLEKGDLQGVVHNVKAGSRKVSVVIDTIKE